LSNSTLSNQRIVDEVVKTLTGPTSDPEQPCDLRLQVSRARDELDSSTAENHCNALVEHLSSNPSSLPELEALIILGLAHPKLLSRHRIPLAQEGRRLALLLERAGQVDRAQSLLEVLATEVPKDKALDHDLASMMRRTGNADRLVDRYLQRAEEAVAINRPTEAIPWLQEVLLIDRSRRDVARMIRDLRYQEEERRNRVRRRVRATAGTILLTACVAGAVLRELDVRQSYQLVQPATKGDLKSLRARYDAIDDLVAHNPLSWATFRASHERSELRAQILSLEALQIEAARVRADEAAQKKVIAESARLRGRQFAEQGNYAEARQQFEFALENATPDWPHRARLESDIAAIVEWQASQSGNPQALQPVPVNQEPKR
jgi:tetratricopeptide (TPR) repeat protein